MVPDKRVTIDDVVASIQDGMTVHVDKEFPVRIGAGVTIGHNAVVQGCTIEDDALIGAGRGSAAVLARSSVRVRWWRPAP